jgi:hypothetical protein
LCGNANDDVCFKKKKKKENVPTHMVSSKIQKEVKNLILAPGFDEVYKSKVMTDEDKESLL